MLVNRKSKLILIHTAKSTLKLDDLAYRALLFGAAGVESSADIEHEGQFRRVMDAFRNAGFVSTAAAKAGTDQFGAIKTQARPNHDDWWGCTEAQRAKIETLWQLVARNPNETALRHFAAKIAKVDAVNFLSVPLATKIILALRRMAATAGYNPDTGERQEKEKACS